MDLSTVSGSVDASDSQQVEVAYLVYREGLSSVFDSQVLTPLALHSKNVSIELAVFSPIGHLVRRASRVRLDAVRSRALELGVRLTVLPSPPSRLRNLWSDVQLLRRWLLRRYGRRPVVLHCRNAEMTTLAIEARRSLPFAKVVYDCRGAEAAETAWSHGLTEEEAGASSANCHQQWKTRKSQERLAATEADRIFAVSSPLKNYLSLEYGRSRTDIVVIPCCLDVHRFETTAREEIRTRLGLHDKFVVMYCGSLAWYQCPQASLRIFRLIQEVEPQAHFLAVTTEAAKMEAEIKVAGISSNAVTVTSVPPREVASILPAGDIALLLRDDSLVNRVASPVKFGEYVAAGVPVILTPGVGDYSAHVVKHQIGCTVDVALSDPTLTNHLANFIPLANQPSMRNRCRDYAEAVLSWDRHIPKLADQYQDLLTLGRTVHGENRETAGIL